MEKRVLILVCAGVLAIGLSSCGKKEVLSDRQQSTISETESELSISEKSDNLSEEQPEQSAASEAQKTQEQVAKDSEGEQAPSAEQNMSENTSEQDATSADENDQSTDNQKTAYADRQEIYLDSGWQYADHSAIHSGAAVMYKAGSNRNGIVVGVNAGHGTSGGSSVRTLCHPDGSVKTTGGSTSAGATKATAVSGGMTFDDGASESSVTLRMAEILRDKLLEAGYDVLMVRDGADVQLDNVARTVICNNVADCHISLHWDGDGLNYDKGSFYISVPDGIKGMEPVASHWKQHNALGQSLVDGLRAQGCKIKGEGSMAIDLTQTSYSTIPSVDMELGNACSDHSDSTLSTQAEGLLQGIKNYFEK